MYFNIFLIALSMAIVTFIILNKILKPVSIKKDKFINETKKAGRSLDQYNLIELRDNMLKKVKRVNMSEEFREEINRDLSRLGWQHTAEDIRKMQVLYTFLFLVFTFFMFFVSTLMAMLMLTFTIFVWNIPVTYIKKAIKERNDEFLVRLDELYTVIFNQYKRKNDEHLGNIISAYLPTATDLMRKELILVLRDIESGEDYALKQLKLRIPNPTIMRFCDIIINNLEGVDNVEVMENFYMELKAVRDRRRRKRNEERERKIDLINKSLYVPFIFLVVVYLIVSTVSNF